MATAAPGTANSLINKQSLLPPNTSVKLQRVLTQVQAREACIVASEDFAKRQNRGGYFPSPAPLTGHNFSGKHRYTAPRRIWLVFFRLHSSFGLLQWSYEARSSCYGRIKTTTAEIFINKWIMNKSRKNRHTLLNPPTILFWAQKCIYTLIRTALKCRFMLALISVLFSQEWFKFHSCNQSLPDLLLI